MRLLSNVRISFGALVIAGTFMLAGCSNDDDSGDNKAARQAAAGINSAFDYAAFGSGFSNATAPIANLLKGLGYGEAAAQTAELAAPLKTGSSDICTASGTAHGTVDGTGTSGSLSFTNCDDGYGYVLNFTISWTLSGTVITVTIEGDMSFTDEGQTISITFSDYEVVLTDEGSGSSSTTINGTISISGTGTCNDGTFVFSTTTPIFYDGILGYTTAGELQVNNATITYNSDGSTTLTVDGQTVDPETVGTSCPA